MCIFYNCPYVKKKNLKNKNLEPKVENKVPAEPQLIQNQTEPVEEKPKFGKSFETSETPTTYEAKEYFANPLSSSSFRFPHYSEYMKRNEERQQRERESIRKNFEMNHYYFPN